MIVRRVYKQGRSNVISLSSDTLNHLSAETGDYVVVEKRPDGKILLYKVKSNIQVLSDSKTTS
jgi:antitoxin component of MazEF toxin-antitoxin module